MQFIIVIESLKIKLPWRFILHFVFAFYLFMCFRYLLLLYLPLMNLCLAYSRICWFKGSRNFILKFRTKITNNPRLLEATCLSLIYCHIIRINIRSCLLRRRISLINCYSEWESCECRVYHYLFHPLIYIYINFFYFSARITNYYWKIDL